MPSLVSPNNIPHAQEKPHDHTSRQFSGAALTPRNSKDCLGFVLVWVSLCGAHTSTSHSPGRRMHCIEGFATSGVIQLRVLKDAPAIHPRPRNLASILRLTAHAAGGQCLDSHGRGPVPLICAPSIANNLPTL
jgi:hypothetical protein